MPPEVLHHLQQPARIRTLPEAALHQRYQNPAQRQHGSWSCSGPATGFDQSLRAQLPHMCLCPVQACLPAAMNAAAQVQLDSACRLVAPGSLSWVHALKGETLQRLPKACFQARGFS